MTRRTCNQHSTPELVVVETRPRRFLRVRDCMADLACSKGFVMSLLKKGRVEGYKLSGLLLVDAASWDAYLDEATPCNADGEELS